MIKINGLIEALDAEKDERISIGGLSRVFEKGKGGKYSPTNFYSVCIIAGGSMTHVQIDTGKADTSFKDAYKLITAMVEEAKEAGFENLSYSGPDNVRAALAGRLDLSQESLGQKSEADCQTEFDALVKKAYESIKK